MATNNEQTTVQDYIQEYSNDPEYIAEKLSIKVIEELLGLLEKKDLNQSLLALKMGVSKAHISRILNAPPNMTLLTLAKLAVAMGTKPDVSLNSEYDSFSLTATTYVPFSFGTFSWPEVITTYGIHPKESKEFKASAFAYSSPGFVIEDAGTSLGCTHPQKELVYAGGQA